MTIAQAIERADVIRPNAVPIDIKTGWVASLDGEFAEMMKVEDYTEPDYSTDELLMDYPRKDVYVFYLCAMIDFAQEEFDLYQDDMAMAIQAISEAKAWWRRNNCPERGIYHRDVWHGRHRRGVRI